MGRSIFEILREECWKHAATSCGLGDHPTADRKVTDSEVLSMYAYTTLLLHVAVRSLYEEYTQQLRAFGSPKYPKHPKTFKKTHAQNPRTDPTTLPSGKERVLPRVISAAQFFWDHKSKSEGDHTVCSQFRRTIHHDM